ncbi:PrsW family intramembrane metalloprotease [Thermasporomyces composti]|jgi:RsiW-degrading membrane proteinase PrsW (M82 family)|uniref:RsiW-degrading membrane proteinase PrsW (M82 family) n=1 Tax=Thermasporomyces composti TaxID=696763 RepID=A0A3D9V612_THECX|nr:PrsW family intramembrane metalloprotease [Thermasporomyces composti]REF36796.1 RsiW-degrading membrane proteinase PrsW (M82 family) [Thermasporomyces composti]
MSLPPPPFAHPPPHGGLGPPVHGTSPHHGWFSGYQPAPVRQRRRVLAPVAALVIMAALILPLIGLTVLGTGPGPVALGTFLALLPVVPVAGVFLWIDRWEPEPGRLLLMAFFWGAGVATVAALLGDFLVKLVWAAIFGTAKAGTLGLVLNAPVIEEAAKGLFLLILVAVRRREFDGIVDGIVYAGLVGVGFAFTENILYLAAAFATGGFQGGVVTFVLRCVLSPFAHPLFTAMTGLAIGVMIRSARPGRILLPVIGYLTAVLLHALWNGSSLLLGGAGFFVVYVLVMVPIFVAMIIVVVWQRRREQRIVATHLPRFVAAGWIAPDEVRHLVSLSGRRGWRAAVKRHWGPEAAKALRDYQTAVTELAFFHDRWARGTVGREAQQWLHDLVANVFAARQRVLSRHPDLLAQQRPT